MAHAGLLPTSRPLRKAGLLYSCSGNCCRLAKGDATTLQARSSYATRRVSAPSTGLEAAGASFERLEWLNLGGCTSLSRLVLAEQAPRLVTANITGCGGVRQVGAGQGRAGVQRGGGVRWTRLPGCRRGAVLPSYSLTFYPPPVLLTAGRAQRAKSTSG